MVRIEANSARTRDELDEWDNLIKRTHPDGSVELFEREPRFSRLSRYVDENGNETRYEYDGRGNLLRRVDAVGKPQTRTTEYGYDDYGNRIVARRLGDGVTAEATFTYDYDQAGNLVRAVDPEGNASAYTYDSRGNQLSFTDPLGNTGRNEYDAAGNLLAAINALGDAERYAYDKAGNLVSHTDRRGQVWTFGYDQRNRRISRTDPMGNSAGTQYDLDGDPIRVIDEDGHAQRWAYDPLKRLQSMVDGRGNAVELRYPQAPTDGDSSNAPSRIVYPGFEQAMRYDPRSRVTAISDILGTDVRLTRYEYDKAGNRTATTNAQGNTVTYSYDALNRLVRTTDTLGHVTELAYDNRDNLISVTDANAHRWRFEYDRVNRPLKESNPQGEATLLRYDAAGRLVEITDAAGQHLIYDYDGTGRLTEERHYAGAPSASAPVKRITYSYDEQGNLVAWSDGDQSATLAYDALARLTGETVNYGAFSLGYAYSYYANGRKKSLTYPGGTVYRYRYSEHNELAAVDVGSEGSLTVNDFVWTAPAQITLPGGTVQQRRFNGLLQLTGADVVSPAQRSLLSMSAEYGSLRQLQHRSIDGIGSSYTHDSENRLIDASSSDGVQESYALDAVANRLSDDAAPGTWEYDGSNRLLKAGGTTYGYDANGNLATMTRDGRVSRYFYDVTNRLTRVEDASGTVVARYGYDPMGRRLWKRVGDSITYFLYAQEGLIGEYDASGQETAAYGWRPHGTWGTDPLFYKLGGRYFYAHTDHLGTP